MHFPVSVCAISTPLWACVVTAVLAGCSETSHPSLPASAAHEDAATTTTHSADASGLDSGVPNVTRKDAATTAGHPADASELDSGTDSTTAAPTCKAADPWPTGTVTCRETSDCPQGSTCSSERLPAENCGSPCPGCFMDACKADLDCDGAVCVDAGPFDTKLCVPRCEKAGCLPGQRCEADGR